MLVAAAIAPQRNSQTLNACRLRNWWRTDVMSIWIWEFREPPPRYAVSFQPGWLTKARCYGQNCRRAPYRLPWYCKSIKREHATLWELSKAHAELPCVAEPTEWSLLLRNHWIMNSDTMQSQWQTMNNRGVCLVWFDFCLVHMRYGVHDDMVVVLG